MVRLVKRVYALHHITAGASLAWKAVYALRVQSRVRPTPFRLFQTDLAPCCPAETAQVQDDLEQAVAAASLEAGSVVGSQPGQVPPHRLLFCSTLEGKVAIVRQIEPDVHFESHQGTAESLARFGHQIVLVGEGAASAGSSSSSAAGAAARNLGRAQSLAHFFGQQQQQQQAAGEGPGTS